MIISIIVISILGTLLHFTYELSGNNKIVGLFSSVNESVWEHIKIAITPTIIWSLIDGFKYGHNPNYFTAKLVCLLLLIIIIPLIYYLYKAITKKDITIINILSFYIAIIISQYLFYYILRLNPVSYIIKYLSVLGLFIFFGCYLLLTLLAIRIELFKNPINNKYGYERRN